MNQFLKKLQRTSSKLTNYCIFPFKCMCGGLELCGTQTCKRECWKLRCGCRTHGEDPQKKISYRFCHFVVCVAFTKCTNKSKWRGGSTLEIPCFTTTKMHLSEGLGSEQITMNKMKMKMK